MIRVAFACNNPSTGAFAGTCSAVEFSTEGSDYIAGFVGEELGLELLWSRMVLKELRDPSGTWSGVTRLAFSARIHGRARWVGNWCWDEVSMEDELAAELMRWLALAGYEIDQWNEDGPLGEVVRELAVA